MVDADTTAEAERGPLNELSGVGDEAGEGATRMGAGGAEYLKWAGAVDGCEVGEKEDCPRLRSSLNSSCPLIAADNAIFSESADWGI
jgi:hypothetical protein